jgi:hypothetical protein
MHYHGTRYVARAARLILLVDAAETFSETRVPIVGWNRAVLRRDMRQYVDDLWASSGLSPLERELCAAMTREVAGWCPETAERITGEGLDTAFRPYDLLKRIAKERQWNGGQAADWRFGSLDQYDLRELTHPAHAIACSDTREVRRRLWRAQLEVLFPVLEMVRTEFAERYPELLQNLAMEDGKLVINRDGSALNPLDLDIGPMVYWLTAQRGNRLSVDQIQLLRGVGEARKSLAHCKAITASGWNGIRERLIGFIDGGMDIRGAEFMRLAAHIQRRDPQADAMSGSTSSAVGTPPGLRPRLAAPGGR